MSKFLTDNRYGAGNSGATLPDEGFMCAAYAARWIDGRRVDIVPDRQGLAYDRPEQRDLLIKALGREEPHTLIDFTVGDDEPTLLVVKDDIVIFVRRSGGYVYVDAWLWAEGYGGGDVYCRECRGAGEAESNIPGVLGTIRCGCTA